MPKCSASPVSMFDDTANVFPNAPSARALRIAVSPCVLTAPCQHVCCQALTHRCQGSMGSCTPKHCPHHARVQLGSQPVFAKHRDMLFFPTAAYAWTVTLLRIPYSLGVIVPWCTLTYFSVGLTVSAGRCGPCGPRDRLLGLWGGG